MASKHKKSNREIRKPKKAKQDAGPVAPTDNPVKNLKSNPFQRGSKA